MCIIDIISIKYTRSYNIQSVSYPDVGMIFDKSILSRCQKLADAYHAGTLESCSRTKNEQKDIQNTVIEVETRTLSK